MFGYHRVELIGRTIWTLIPQEFRDRHVTHRQGYVADPRNREIGIGLVLKGLRRRDAEFTVQTKLSPMVMAGLGSSILAAMAIAKEAACSDATQSLQPLKLLALTGDFFV
jgi:PAS domain S-box-containing protein